MRAGGGQRLTAADESLLEALLEPAMPARAGSADSAADAKPRPVTPSQTVGALWEGYPGKSKERRCGLRPAHFVVAG